MDIKIRFMTFDELDKYQDYIEGLAEKGMKENKVSRMGAEWILKNIYDVDIRKCNMRPGDILSIVSKTVEETFKVEKEEEKN